MSDRFLQASIDAVKRNGSQETYTQVQTGTYNVETGSVTNTETNHTVWMYKRHVKTSQYSYPNLIGSDVGIFYLANDALVFVPAVKDKIIWGGKTYTVDSFEEHIAHGQVVLYKVVAAR